MKVTSFQQNVTPEHHESILKQKARLNAKLELIADLNDDLHAMVASGEMAPDKAYTWLSDKVRQWTRQTQ